MNTRRNDNKFKYSFFMFYVISAQLFCILNFHRSRNIKKTELKKKTTIKYLQQRLITTSIGDIIYRNEVFVHKIYVLTLATFMATRREHGAHGPFVYTQTNHTYNAHNL